MSLRVRLALLMVLLTALPAIPAALVTRNLIQRSLHLGLSADVDEALEAGVRVARRGLWSQRRDLQSTLEAWAASWPGPELSPQASVRRMQSGAADTLPEMDRVVLFDPGGRAHTVQAGDVQLLQDVAAPSRGEPPRQLSARRILTGGWALDVRRPAEDEWHRDATKLAATLQLIRGLRAEQSHLERSFWLPFVVIYAAALLIGVLTALRLGRGITLPVHRLLDATGAVASGRWDVQVPATGRDEIGRLSRQFNSMVRTLDAQSRRLIDLETMAGWREMARVLAHEVKNPLTPIQLTVEEMRERYRGDDPQYKKLLHECARIVVQEVNSLRNVVTRFREFSRPVELQPASVDLNPLVEDVAALQRDLAVQLELEPGLGEVRVDEDRLRQVLMNLAANARTATREMPSPRVLFATSSSGDRVSIVVEDNGPGIPAAERERVFDPYHSGTTGGLGLGLALVKGIVLAHEGTIHVERGRWGGACFRIDLPRRKA
ncbi:MAG: ATP-binding protein [Candidatus Krumholzibacteriia bacterium]